ncbi:DUF885 domain-containing protein [Paremcibacter congregatus]|uniref:DUF885 domain-containing protein n=1 Tax=Paremcibacter congregatus TaxID=2043170 RepID=A0A2G4YP71_9PROT|nr:DUF885 domain-containing protein [Paremcibacter congregatus]PHZ84114.1 DUF885 domain-containing protein [Paremcibacter congregatus]QDE25827.1 DUF885 domain-containing protein [Paremcibacter congregatus]
MSYQFNLKQKAVAGISALLLSSTSVFAVDEAPAKINDFFEAVFIEAVMDSPESLTYTRLMEQQGKPWRHDELDDNSRAHADALIALQKHNYDVLKTYDEAALSDSERLSKQIMTWTMENDFRNNKFRDHDYEITQLDGLMTDYPLFMNGYHQVSDQNSAEDYVARLHAVGAQFENSMKRLKLQQEKGIILPKFLIRKVIDNNTAFTATAATENILYKTLAKKLDGAKGMTAADKTALLARAQSAIETEVYPAYNTMIVYFKDLEKIATNEAGVWKLPDGEAYYAAQIQSNTTTKMSAEEIHNIGLREVDRIQGEILGILKGEGYDTSAGFEPLIQQLAEEERFYYPDTDAGRAQILKDYQTIIDEVNETVSGAFNVKPRMGVDVQRVPKFSEKTAPGAYYSGPALDGSRPGTFWANLYDIKATPKYGMRTLSYHEAVPGHHFQIAIAQELKDIPMFRKFGGFTAYVEGWALYSEKLAKEMGLQDDPYDDIGRLQAELFRAVRLVVDTGMHHKRWTRDEAVDYMAKNTGMAMSDVVTEIERYIVWPGQALAYKVGMMKIVDLRAKAKKALGAKFDIRTFHDVVLTNGALPLDILAKQVEDYAAGK